MKNFDGKFELDGQEYFFRAKDDSGSSEIVRVNHEEHCYRIVEIINKKTQSCEAVRISTGDTFTVFPDMVKNQYKNYLSLK